MYKKFKNIKQMFLMKYLKILITNYDSKETCKPVLSNGIWQWVKSNVTNKTKENVM